MPPVRALVTGSAGFVGGYLTEHLRSSGDDVIGFDDSIDITDGEALRSAMVAAAPDVVYHLAAASHVGSSWSAPVEVVRVNVEGTLNVLLAARDEAVRRVVFSSSTSVYGSSRMLPTAESQPPDPISPYGVAKLAAERYCVSFSRVYDLETVVLRYFNVFGPRQSPLSQYAAVIPLFIAAISKGEPIVIHGDGEQSRDFTYVSNVLDATIRAGEAAGASGRIFNVAAGAPASVNAVAETIGRLLDRPVEKHSAPPRAGDIRDSWADISAARDVLGYEPAVRLDEGLRLTIEALAT
jgi:UDP-glucose 4-epimerase